MCHLVFAYRVFLAFRTYWVEQKKLESFNSFQIRSLNRRGQSDSFIRVRRIRNNFFFFYKLPRKHELFISTLSSAPLLVLPFQFFSELYKRTCRLEIDRRVKSYCGRRRFVHNRTESMNRLLQLLREDRFLTKVARYPDK